jgi:hypothetical protein
MTPSDRYRAKAAELQAKALEERSGRRSLEALVLLYLRLADQADQNSKTDIVYGPLIPPRGGGTEPETK